MQRTPDQQPSHLIGGAATVQKYCIAVFNQGNGCRSNRLLFFPLYRLIGVEMRQFWRAARVKNPPMDSTGGSHRFPTAPGRVEPLTPRRPNARPVRATKQSYASAPTRADGHGVPEPACVSSGKVNPVHLYCEYPTTKGRNQAEMWKNYERFLSYDGALESFAARVSIRTAANVWRQMNQCWRRIATSRCNAMAYVSIVRCSGGAF